MNDDTDERVSEACMVLLVVCAIAWLLRWLWPAAPWYAWTLVWLYAAKWTLMVIVGKTPFPDTP